MIISPGVRLEEADDDREYPARACCFDAHVAIFVHRVLDVGRK
jgi:hypothetical protein